LLWPGALTQLPLSLQARAGGATVIKVKARAAADKVESAIFKKVLWDFLLYLILI
jgi:hypothetical protein